MEDNLARTIEIIRKPEARTEYSDILKSTALNYIDDIFKQENPPEGVKNFKERNGLIILSGSALRGNADVLGTKDVDMAFICDADNYFSKYDVVYKDTHPEKMSFGSYLARSLKASPETTNLYKQKLDWYLHWFGSRGGKSLSILEDAQKRSDLVSRFDEAFINEDYTTISIDDWIQNGINKGDLTYLNDESQDRNSRMLVEVLTTTPDLVYESSEGALLHHQRKIIDALQDLKIKDERGFNAIWKNMQEKFVGMHRSQEWRKGKSEIDEKQLTEYVRASGRFKEEQVKHATSLLRSIRSQTSLPSLEEFIMAYGVKS